MLWGGQGTQYKLSRASIRRWIQLSISRSNQGVWQKPYLTRQLQGQAQDAFGTLGHTSLEFLPSLRGDVTPSLGCIAKLHLSRTRQPGEIYLLRTTAELPVARFNAD